MITAKDLNKLLPRPPGPLPKDEEDRNSWEDGKGMNKRNEGKEASEARGDPALVLNKPHPTLFSWEQEEHLPSALGSKKGNKLGTSKSRSK